MAKVLAVGCVVGLAAAVHPDREAQIEKINQTPGVTWKAAANPRFSKYAPGVERTIYGVKGDWKKDIDDAIARGEIQQAVFPSNAEDIPDEFDSITRWPKCAKVIGDIRDQSNCGCCWAFGGASAASSRMCIASNATLQMPLSAQDICFNAQPPQGAGGCAGGFVRDPWHYIQHTGAVTGGQVDGTETFGKGWCSKFALPHCHHHGPQGDDPYPAEGDSGCPKQRSPRGPKQCDVDADAPHNDFARDKYTWINGAIIAAKGESDIQQAIMAGGPMETAFTVYSDFEDYASGIYQHVTGSQVGGHAVGFVGWGVDNGVKYWKVQNSWNPYWGEKGYFRILRGSNEGGIEACAVASDQSSTWGPIEKFSTISV